MDIEENDTGPTYRWELVTSRAWDDLREDESGNIITLSESDRSRSRLAKINRVTKSIRRGLIRYMVLAIDASASLSDKDMRPCRLHVVKEKSEKFILQYFDQNPISQLSVISTSDRTARKLTDLSGNPRHQVQSLESITGPKGAPSIQSALHMAIGVLRHVPDYGHREMLLIFGSLSTCDPGDIFKTIEECVTLKIRCSVICLSAEVFICHRIAQLTGGSFQVAVDAHHFDELIMSHVTPPPDLKSRSSLTTKFVYLGFPKRIHDPFPMCCYDGSKMCLMSGSSFQCPRCKVRNTQLPTQCQVCGLQLYSSSHIARSHHHMFPVPNFSEIIKVTSAKDTDCKEAEKLNNGSGISVNGHNGVHQCSYASSYCSGCNHSFVDDSLSLRTECPKCKAIYCVECDIFIHDSLHNCPECC